LILVILCEDGNMFYGFILLLRDLLFIFSDLYIYIKLNVLDI